MGETNRETDYVSQNNHNDIRKLIDAASKVIVPLSSISVFAARSPWSGLEDKTFDEVAHWLKQVREVDIYPAIASILEAKKQGEIDDCKIEERFQQWLEQASLAIPRESAVKYGRNALKLHPLKSNQHVQEQVDALAQQLEDVDLSSDVKSSTSLLSTYVMDENNKKLIDTVDYHVIKWCKLFVDDAQSGWTMPHRDKGLFYSWRRLVQYDPALTKHQRARLKTLPDDAESLIRTTLLKLGIAEEDTQNYLENHLLSLPGWAGMMLWQHENNSKMESLLLDYLAIRLGIEWVIMEPYLSDISTNDTSANQSISLPDCILSWMQWGGFTAEQWDKLTTQEQQQHVLFAAQFNDQLRRKLLLEAWEATYNQQLRKIIAPEKQALLENDTPLAQMAFCIDVRSEPFRKQIEAAGPFETIGIAGFFGLPIAKNELGNQHSHPSLPVMSKPQHKIKEYTQEKEPTIFRQRKHVLESVTYTFKKMKQNVLPSLLLPELSGPWLTLQTFTRSFIPNRVGNGIRRFYAGWLQKPEDTALTLDHHHRKEDGLPVGFTKDEQLNYTRQALRLMDLTTDFSPLVVMCGHGSQSANNPYAASLDCGACGGAASGFNGKVLAKLCNLPEVRQGLAREGIEIPETTVFAAAEHQTSVDVLEWVYVPELPEEAQKAYDAIEAAMPNVSYYANEQRLEQLPNNNVTKKNPVNEAHRLSNDWSEIRPEWGLAKNASFIIGQRELTKHGNLQGRAFLHNYDWKNDLDGSILANIIGGPAVVAQWINLQYYASTVAPHYYGSGSKTTQTVTAGIGVMQGNASDLLTGLPWQSVMSSDDKMYHSPIRLLVVIQAPEDFVKERLEADKAFQQKVQNGWVRLATIDEDGQWHDWSTDY
ncbi:MAG: Na-translocating system protein MpsB [Staphylococcus equorum]|nr:Na-translocating system protein MpsB [Staphylococcus equorum]